MIKKNLIAKLRKTSLAFVILTLASIAYSTTRQQSFKDPENAVQALIAAIKNSAFNQLEKILGPKAKIILESGDEKSNEERRKSFLEKFAQSHELEKSGDAKLSLKVGNDGWQFPIPLVKKDQGWQFDTKAGEEEILNRQIGRNELSTIQALLAYVDAQREYYLTNPEKNAISSYAQKFMSTPGKRDGLYYPVKKGEKLSPLGELYANAQASLPLKREADSEKHSYHGYRYRILTKQGSHAPGGAYDYIAQDKLFGGHAVIAWPASYQETGIMSFMVNQDGIVYEKDLGEESEKEASKISKYDPDKSWKPAKISE